MKRVKWNIGMAYKGIKLPDNTKRVDRGAKYGNLFKVGEYSLQDSLKNYEIYLDFAIKKKLLNIEPLIGYDLACSCELENNCHADILLKKVEELKNSLMVV